MLGAGFEGAVIGAGVLGVTSVFIAAGFCGLNESGSSCGAGAYLGAAAIGGVVGAGFGGLVGGLFDAPSPHPLRGHPGRAAFMGAVAGALWSVGFLCHGLGHGCGDLEAAFGLSSSAVGALAGLLVAR